MRKIALSIAILATMLLPVLGTAPAQALNDRTWVSGTGSDSGSCPITAPCQTFQYAMSETAAGGQINCLTPGSFGASVPAVNITQSITIDCHEVFASVLPPMASDAFLIQPSGGVVTLRNLNIDCAGGGGVGIYIFAASTVYIEDVMITGCVTGISDNRRTGGTRLFVRNSIIRNNTGPGVVAAASATNAVVLENVHSVGNKYGVAAATGNNVVVSRSVISGNATAGVEADSGAQVFVDNTEITHNIGYGIEAFGTVVLANSDLSYNSAAISGSPISYGNNRIFGNPEASPAPAPIGAVSNNDGQQ